MNSAFVSKNVEMGSN